MPRLNFVKAARKDVPNSEIKKGESYFWWKFRRGGKHVSKTRPRRSALTQSPFYAPLWDIEDALAELTASMSWDDIRSARDTAVDELTNLASEQEEKLSNMPDSLQEGPTGELLQSRADGCEEMASELEAVDLDGDEPEDDQAKDAEIIEAAKEAAISDLQGVGYTGD